MGHFEGEQKGQDGPLEKPIKDKYTAKSLPEPQNQSFDSQNRPSSSKKTAEWGIYWLREPLQMPLLTLCGISLAIGHHVLYWRLDNTIVPDNNFSQQAVKQIGNVFAFLMVASCKAAIYEAYTQYIWTIFRRKALEIAILDKVFSLTYNVTSFWSFRLVKEAKLACLLGLCSWWLFLGGLTPAATLSIVSATRTNILPQSVSIPDYNLSSWSQIEMLQTEQSFAPTAHTLKISTQSAFDAEVIPPPAPALNSSFSVHFYGPTVRCNSSTPDQQELFDNFTLRYRGETGISTAKNQKLPKSGPSLLGYMIFTSFSPTEKSVNTPFKRGVVVPDARNNWNTGIDRPESDTSQSHQIWIQTATTNMVCTIVNASFDIGFEFSNGRGHVAYQDIRVLPSLHPEMGATALPLEVSANPRDNINRAYFTTFLALGNALFGNVTLENGTAGCSGECFTPGFVISEATSRILQTGLVACDDFVNNYWYNEAGYKQTNFESQPWMCRNKTLARGIEDLANNITISMLSSASLTKNVSSLVTTYETKNVYYYEAKFLVISYASVILVTLIAGLIGITSLISNGVYHSTSFSTFVGTTRNLQLDALSEGACLGDTRDLAGEKLMFGVLKRGGSGVNEKFGANWSGVIAGWGGNHAAFGLEGSVVRLRKGQLCS